MSRSKAIGALILMAMAGSAMAAGPAGSKIEAAKAALSKANPDAGFYLTGDRVTTVYGPAFGFGESAEATAETFLAQHAGVFGTDAGDLIEGSLAADNLHVRPLMTNPDGSAKFQLVSYLQQRAGIPVFRSDVRLLVRNEPGFPLVLARAATFDLGDFMVSDAVLNAPAIDAAQNNVATRYMGMVNFTEPTFVIWAGYDAAPAEPRLAITFTGTAFDNSHPMYAKRLFVADAQSGEILFSESQISHIDVTGKIEGQATTGPKADGCSPEAPVGLPYARASIGATVAFADVNGNFVIPNPGSSPVTVQSELAGKWFRTHIGSSGGAVAEAQSKPGVTPPGPANFMFNAANTNETFRGGVNAYYHANVVRDFALKYSPAYPTIGTQTDWPVNVNVSGTCNAFYDGGSINFFLAGGGCNNTAFSVVVHHEYGHHLVNRAGSGQGQYGEGQSDVMGVIIMDDPILAYGFFSNDCNNGIRTAENTKQYPCNGAIHDCGQLISGCVWDTMKELKITNPSDWKDIIGDLAVNAILLHTGDLITPQITIDYLTLDDDDANIGNGTPHYNQIAVGFGKHNMDAPPLQLLQFNYPSGKPALITPLQPFNFPMNVTGVAGTPIANTGKLFYKINNGAFTSVNLVQGAPNNYTVVLPATTCGDNISWYVQANANPGGQLVTDPPFAPGNGTFNTLVAYGTIPGTVTYNFNAGLPNGWTATGLWHVTTACNTPGTCDSGSFASYGLDASCTFNNGGTNAGVLTSPLFLVPPSPNAKLEFCYRYAGEGGTPYDAALVKVNGTTVFDAGANQTNAWTSKSISLASFAGQQVKLEFTFDTVDSIANDFLGFQVDGVKVSGEVADCNKPGCYPDCDGDGKLSIDDFICFQTFFAIKDKYADCDGDGSLTIDDFICFQTTFALGC